VVDSNYCVAFDEENSRLSQRAMSVVAERVGAAILQSSAAARLLTKLDTYLKNKQAATTAAISISILLCLLVVLPRLLRL
jgi:hypothetical protein